MKKYSLAGIKRLQDFMQKAVDMKRNTEMSSSVSMKN